MKQVSYKKTKGFSIGEVMLAMFIMTIGLVGMVELTQSNVVDIAESRDNIVATQLAQEGVELVRNARDNNAAQRFFDGKTGVSPALQHGLFEGFSPGHCAVDYVSFYRTAGASSELYCGSDTELSIDGFGLYQHGGGTSTKFRRSVYLQGNSAEYEVTGFVTWDGSNPATITDVGDCNIKTKCVYTQNVLTDWIEPNES